MRKLLSSGCSLPFLVLLLLNSAANAGDTFRVATYNVENYLDRPTESRPAAKSAPARAKICESIRALAPDIIALEEMGGTNALLELRLSLKADGLDYPAPLQLAQNPSVRRDQLNRQILVPLTRPGEAAKEK